MKKRILFSLAIIGIMAVSSVKAQVSIGPGIVYGTKVESIGISANINYDFAKKFGVIGAYNYFFDKMPYLDGSNSNWWTIDVDGAYYCCKTGNKSNLYVLGGLNLIYYKYPTTLGDEAGTFNNYMGMNIGAGWKLGMGSKMDVVPEVRYTIGDVNYLRIGVKLMFGL